MNRSDVLQALDELVSERSILNHPFYVAWERGELTRPQLATYASVYYPHVHAFPRYLESAIAAADDSETRAELTRNLTDELTHPKPHHELWLDFAEALGLDRLHVASSPPHSSATAMMETFERLTSEDVTSGVTALYAYESQQPEVSDRKMVGLRKFYGVDSAKGLAYFDVHASADLHHRQGERDALSRCLDAGDSAERILSTATDALDAYWGLLDGVCAVSGITPSC